MTSTTGVRSLQGRTTTDDSLARDLEVARLRKPTRVYSLLVGHLAATNYDGRRRGHHSLFLAVLTKGRKSSEADIMLALHATWVLRQSLM
ncbi:hypothetical protein PsYK624_165790 [Phanerochaete sordida]|uniref:Uncharacterized protein n=1 Tax=Phanerochaete sordida TaxID=48140 RepID=A0A9P3GWU5_9APHY|nr:hypothetical protein PsYK624_165790 [Phanerochaete sordida]